jgi:protoporphyrinogen oxidase
MRIGIVGGGITGLACAHYALRAGLKPVVLEASEIGGVLAQRFGVAGTELECFHSSLCTTDTALCGLLSELGLSAQVVWRSTRAALFCSDSAEFLSTPRDLLGLRALGLGSRLRAALGTGSARLPRYLSRMNRIPAQEWLRRTLGKEAFDLLGAPWLEASFGRSDDVPAYLAWRGLASWGRFAQGAHGHLRGGHRALAAALRRSVEAGGGAVHSLTRVLALEWAGGVARVETEAGELRFDALISTLGLPDLAKVAQGELLRVLPFSASHPRGEISVVALAERPLGPYYHVTPIGRGTSFSAVRDAGQLLPAAERGALHPIYVTRRCDPQSPEFHASDESLRREALELLHALSGRPLPVRDVRIFRTPHADLAWSIGDLEHRLPARLGATGVFLCPTAHAYPRPVSTDTSIMLARETVGLLGSCSADSGQIPRAAIS